MKLPRPALYALEQTFRKNALAKPELATQMRELMGKTLLLVITDQNIQCLLCPHAFGIDCFNHDGTTDADVTLQGTLSMWQKTLALEAEQPSLLNVQGEVATLQAFESLLKACCPDELFALQRQVTRWHTYLQNSEQDYQQYEQTDAHAQPDGLLSRLAQWMTAAKPGASS